MASQVITLHKSRFDELNDFHAMEEQAHARNYVNQTSLEDHQTNFNDVEIVYLSIENDRRELLGYFILAFECNDEDIEFRRIV
ncbi:MAG: hypothetical protein GXP29_03005 [Planctomycetes bacterium]|nr:hypothetical protein [Planctomycetota bacterium]